MSSNTKLLVVEDKLEEVKVLKEFVTELASTDAHFVLSRDAAVEKLNAEEFDLVILDLQIPPNDGSLSPHIDHGMATLENIQQIQPWAAVYFFSAHGTIDRVRDLLDGNRKEDIFASGELQSMTRFFQKTELTKCTEAISAYAKALTELDEIVFLEEPKPECLHDEDARILKLFARSLKGTKIRAELLTGGKSSAKTLRVIVHDDNNSVRSLAVGKLDKAAKVKKEIEGFKAFVDPVLPVGSFAHHISSVNIGARGSGGNFFGLASQYPKNIYQLLSENEQAACEVVRKLRGYQASWLQNAPRRTSSVSAVRKHLINDQKFEPFRNLFESPWLEDAELKEFEIVWCPQHGDLHGFNVLLDDSLSPLLIDYAETGEAPAAFDPVILELSVWFHPDAQFLREGRDAPKFEDWGDLEKFQKTCPWPQFTKECRDWSFDDARQDAVGAYVTAFGFSCKQLKYPDVNKSDAVKVATAALKQAEVVGL